VYAPSAPQDSHGANALDLANLAMLTGNVGRPSSGVYPLLDHSNQQGACDMGALPDFLPGYQRIADESVRSKFEAEWNCSLSFGRGLTAAEMVEAAIQGQVRAIYLMGGDSALSGLDAQRAKALADKVEFLVVQDMVLSEAAKRADVVLPACSFAEKDGTFTNTERRVQRVRKVIGEVGQSKPDWWILCQVAQRMGARGFEYAGPSQIMEEIAQLTPDYAGISYPRLEAGGLQWPCPSDGHPGTPVLHSSGFIIGKGKFASRPAYSADASSTFAA
jgi:predicted molibdopterin-dependent oxidoreductase YjgC